MLSIKSYNISFCICVGTPVIIDPPKDQSIHLSTETSFTCTAVGYVRPKVEWFKNYNILNNQTLGATKFRRFIYTTKIGDCSTSECGVISTVMISNVTSDDVGIYTCNASNPVGYAIESAQLKIGNLRVYITHCVIVQSYIAVANCGW